jgi:hypothetical protein
MLLAPTSESKESQSACRFAEAQRATQPPRAPERQQRFAKLQQAVGNQAILRMLSRSDRPVLRRECACGGSGGECAACKEKEKQGPLQRQSAGTTGAAGVPPVVHEVLRSAGQPLDARARAFFEPRFGHDLGSVRVHADARSAESASSVNANAYTVGSDVVFAKGQYAPHTAAGRRLLAHELTHVLQQRQTVQASAAVPTVAMPDTPLEHEADRVAELVMAPDARVSHTISAAGHSVQRACLGAIGHPSGCAGVEGDVLGDHFLFKVGCDDFRKPPDHTTDEEARLRLFAETVSSGDSLEIHGFSSEEGNPAFNDDLSCARALKAQFILNTEFVTAGKSVSSTLLKHGATAGNREERRSVYIDWHAAAPTPAHTPGPAAPAPSGPACVPRTGITEYGCYCGAGSSCPAGLTCPPMDALDACCQAHDACYGACPGCTIGDSMNPLSGNFAAARACDMALCACAAGLTLTGRADTYRNRMLTVFQCP